MKNINTASATILNTVNTVNIDNAREIYVRTTTPADGQGLISVIYGAYLACSLRIISENELDILEEEMSKVKNTEEMLGNRRLMKIVNKIPKAFQVRHKHTGIKGMFLVFPLELVDQTKNLDIIVTDGLSKYGNGSWESTDLEVCAYLKRKNEWVALNVQFINALTNYDNPSFLTPIVDYWHNMAMSTLDDDIMKLKFHNIVSSFGDESEDNDLRLATALKTCISLKNEKYMLKLASDQYKKFYEGLMTGRMKVQGLYSYMITDPLYMLNQLYGTNLPELKAGQYWMNGKQCKAGLFRSPLIAPFEAQKVQLVSHEFFDVFYKDITIFNGHDGIWELMSGADFDGDTCACIPEDTALGKIIVDAIQDSEYVILHEAKSAKEVKYNAETFWKDLASYNATVARADRTGIITNHATKAIEMWHHLKSCMYYAKRNGCKGLYLAHPNELPKDEYGKIVNNNPHSIIVNGEKLFAIRGLVYADKENNFAWTEMYKTGKYSFDEVEELMKKFMLKVEYLNPIQGDEIDGAKTGYYPELFKAIEIPFQSEQTTNRNKIVGKSVSKTAMNNSYISYSPLGIVFKYAESKYNEFLSAVEGKATDKVALLKNLLTEEEDAQLRMSVNDNGNIKSLIEYLKERKSAYGKKIYSIVQDTSLTSEEKMTKISAHRDGVDILENGNIKHYKGEREILLDIAKAIGITEELMAVACYIATNINASSNSSLAYGWLLFDQLLSVFARNNAQVIMYKVPNYTENVSIVNGNLLVNDKKYGTVDAKDCSYVPVRNINGRLFALVRKNEELEIIGRAITGSIHEIKVLGFKYQNQSVASFKEAYCVAKQIDIVDIEGTPYAFINDIKFAQVQGFTTNELVGHSVVTAPSPNYKETEASMMGLCVRVIR